MLSNLKRVLCATDGSHSSEKAVEYAIDMARKLGIGISFATVIPLTDADLAEEPMFWDSEIEEAADVQEYLPLEIASGRAKKVGLEDVKYVILHGRDIGGNIVKYAEENGYHHIVVGSRGSTGLARILLGSTGEDIVRHAHCPVTVVR
ncbi:MAG: universal stress protein [Chromatiales bacterium]